jgi:hypothetical protein
MVIDIRGSMAVDLYTEVANNGHPESLLYEFLCKNTRHVLVSSLQCSLKRLIASKDIGEYYFKRTVFCYWLSVNESIVAVINKLTDYASKNY